MMQLYWSSRSPFVRKVMVAAHETGLADRIERIPALVLDDGTTLFDSGVICEYLDGLHEGPKLFPPSGPARIAALRWQALGTGYCDMLVLWRGERAREVPSAAILDGFGLKHAAVLKALEAEAPALVAAPFGIGHVTIGCALSYLDFRFAALGWRAGCPALAEWHEGFRARPSVRATEYVDA